MLKDFLINTLPEDLPLAFPLGKDEKGDFYYCDLSRMPHLLLAGKNPEEKKAFLHGMLASFSGASSEEVKFFLAGEEGDFLPYSDDPHLLCPVSTDCKRVLSCLTWLCVEMERRFQEFRNAGVRDIHGFNEKKTEILPRIVGVISEIRLLSPIWDEAVDALCRICQLGRAAGIHLVLATGFPEEKVLSCLLKASVPSRISFATETVVESRCILDQGGAEELSPGELLYLPLAARKPVKIFYCNK